MPKDTFLNLKSEKKEKIEKAITDELLKIPLNKFLLVILYKGPKYQEEVFINILKIKKMQSNI